MSNIGSILHVSSSTLILHGVIKIQKSHVFQSVNSQSPPLKSCAVKYRNLPSFFVIEHLCNTGKNEEWGNFYLLPCPQHNLCHLVGMQYAYAICLRHNWQYVSVICYLWNILHIEWMSMIMKEIKIGSSFLYVRDAQIFA